MTPSQLLSLLFENTPPVSAPDIRTFLKTNGPGVPAEASAFERLVRVAMRADRRLLASAAGHQAAVRRLFPDTPDDAVTAFCVSEEQGPRPSKIFTKLTPAKNGFVLSGRKKWGSMSPVSDVLYVAASIGEKDGRNQLRMVQVATDRAGVTIDTSGYDDYRDHMPIADINLDNVEIIAGEVIEADAYDCFIKPFRLVEDVYNTVGTQIGLLQLGRAHDWPQDVLEDLVSLILQAHTISRTDMAGAEAVLLMSSYYRASGILWDRLGESWARVPEAIRAGWSPDTGTLGVAARARETRRQNAWAALA